MGRPGADPDVEGVHHHPRSAGVRQVREGANAGQVGHGREPHLQAGHQHLQESDLRGKISSKNIELSTHKMGGVARLLLNFSLQFPCSLRLY